MLVTASGMMTDVNSEHPSNVEIPILSIDLGIVMFFRCEQPKNAAFPMFVTELGIVSEVMPKHP